MPSSRTAITFSDLSGSGEALVMCMALSQVLNQRQSYSSTATDVQKAMQPIERFLTTVIIFFNTTNSKISMLCAELSTLHTAMHT